MSVMAQGILVINAGSSSVKFAVFADGGQPEPRLLFKGQMEGLGSDPSFQAKDAAGQKIDERDEWPRGSTLNHAGALRYIPERALCTVEDVGIATAFLATDYAKMITGDVMCIDGGYHILG